LAAHAILIRFVLFLLSHWRQVTTSEEFIWWLEVMVIEDRFITVIFLIDFLVGWIVNVI
jgi:hypothetical protein